LLKSGTALDQTPHVYYFISLFADVASALLSEILTNNASGAIMYPIAAIAGDKQKIEVRVISLGFMVSRSVNTYGGLIVCKRMGG
jgi:hypothetical protein